MKKKIFLFLILIFIFLPFIKPVMYAFYMSNTTKIVTFYRKNDLSLLDIDDPVICEIVREAVTDGEVFVKLPNQMEQIKIIAKSEIDKNTSAYFKTCFTDNDLYCFITRCSFSFYPENTKTHKWDQLNVFDKNGNLIYYYKSTEHEWILDYQDENILLFNSDEYSVYRKSILTGDIVNIDKLEYRKYSKSEFTYSDNEWHLTVYENGVPTRTVNLCVSGCVNGDD